MDPRIENLLLPVNVAERETIKNTPVPKWEQSGSWDRNWHRDEVIRSQSEVEQIEEVLSKREQLAQLAEMLKNFKENTTAAAKEISDFVKKHDMDSMVDFDVYSECDYYGMIDTNDVVGDALRWASSDHSC